MRVIFMGTPAFSVPALHALAAAGHRIVAAYSQPPRPAGRGKAPRPSPVETAARAMGVPTFTPTSLKSEAAAADVLALGADIAVVVAYGLILPQPILDAPAFGCLNIHASLLPRWRGAAPIQRAIMAGDRQSGVSIMQMDAGLDTGPVRLCRTIDLAADETAADLHDRLATLGARAIVDVLDDLDAHPPVAQSDAGVTYADKIDKAEARIDWAEDAVEIDRKIRGLSPFPGAWSDVGGTRLKFLQSRVADGSGPPGQVLDDGLRVAAGRGAVQILRLQRPGRGAAETGAFLRGHPIAAGTRFA